MSSDNQTGDDIESVDRMLELREEDYEGNVAQHHVNMYNQLIQRIDDIPFFCSLPQHDTGTALKMHNYKNTFEQAVPFMKNGQGIMAKDIMVYMIQFTDDEDKLVNTPSMILIDENGKGYRIISKMLVKQILEFIRDWHPLPLDPPVRMRCEDRIMPNGNRTYQLILGD